MKKSGKTYDLIVVGAGAAGLAAAIVSGRRNVSVLVLEQNAKAGKKITISGNGRCNISNRNITHGENIQPK